MKRILFVSRHPPLDSQREALRRDLRDRVVIDQAPQRLRSAEEIKARFEAGKYDDLVVVAPWTMISRLVSLGIRPIYAEMQDVDEAQGETRVGGRWQRFVRFRRVENLQPQFVEVAGTTPTDGRDSVQNNPENQVNQTTQV